MKIVIDKKGISQTNINAPTSVIISGSVLATSGVNGVYDDGRGETSISNVITTIASTGDDLYFDSFGGINLNANLGDVSIAASPGSYIAMTTPILLGGYITYFGYYATVATLPVGSDLGFAYAANCRCITTTYPTLQSAGFGSGSFVMRNASGLWTLIGTTITASQ